MHYYESWEARDNNQLRTDSILNLMKIIIVPQFKIQGDGEMPQNTCSNLKDAVDQLWPAEIVTFPNRTMGSQE